MTTAKLISIIKYSGFFLFVGFITFIFIDFEGKTERALKGVETEAIVIEKKRLKLTLKYTAEGRDWYKKTERKARDVYRSYQIGDKYILKYDPNYPDYGVVLYHRPIITEAEFESTYTTSIDGHGSLVRFEYVAEGTKYTRFQVVDPDKKFDPAPYKGKSYMVKFNKFNPAIGYVFLDSIWVLR